MKSRILRVAEADHMHEWDTALAAHDNTQLAAIRADGFDAVWLRGVLREIVRTDVFPELAPGMREFTCCNFRHCLRSRNIWGS